MRPVTLVIAGSDAADRVDCIESSMQPERDIMLTRRSFAQVLLLSLGLASAVTAQTIPERLDRAQQRIEHGRRSGSLSHHEAQRLMDEYAGVRRFERHAWADGHLDRHERERLAVELDRLERHISRFKNNDEYRGDGRGGPRRY